MEGRALGLSLKDISCSSSALSPPLPSSPIPVPSQSIATLLSFPLPPTPTCGILRIFSFTTPSSPQGVRASALAILTGEDWLPIFNEPIKQMSNSEKQKGVYSMLSCWEEKKKSHPVTSEVHFWGLNIRFRFEEKSGGMYA